MVLSLYFKLVKAFVTLSIGILLYEAKRTVVSLKNAVIIVFLIVFVFPVPGGPCM